MLALGGTVYYTGQVMTVVTAYAAKKRVNLKDGTYYAVNGYYEGIETAFIKSAKIKNGYLYIDGYLSKHPTMDDIGIGFASHTEPNNKLTYYKLPIAKNVYIKQNASELSPASDKYKMTKKDFNDYFKGNPYGDIKIIKKKGKVTKVLLSYEM